MINWVLFANCDRTKKNHQLSVLTSEFSHRNKRGHKILLITILHVIITFCVIITA